MLAPLLCFVIDSWVLDLDDLASPAMIAQRPTLDMYASHISRTKLFLEKYVRLSGVEQHRLLSEWFRKIEPKLDGFVRENSKNSDGDLSCGFLTEEMSQADLSKIDIIFLAQGRGAIFHTEQWLRELYGVWTKDEFRLPSEPVFPQSIFGFHSGPSLAEPACSAFDAFMNQERGFAIRWFRSNFDDRQLNGMTDARMGFKLQQVLFHS